MFMVNTVSSLTFKLGFSRQRWAALSAEFDLKKFSFQRRQRAALLPWAGGEGRRRGLMGGAGKVRAGGRDAEWGGFRTVQLCGPLSASAAKTNGPCHPPVLLLL